jgi:hypothetical protein
MREPVGYIFQVGVADPLTAYQLGQPNPPQDNEVSPALRTCRGSRQVKSFITGHWAGFSYNIVLNFFFFKIAGRRK